MNLLEGGDRSKRTLVAHKSFTRKAWTRWALLSKYGHRGMRGIHLYAGKGDLIRVHLDAGASAVLCVDKDARALGVCKRRYGALVTTVTADVYAFLKGSKLDPVDFVDMDPHGSCARTVAVRRQQDLETGSTSDC